MAGQANLPLAQFGVGIDSKCEMVEPDPGLVERIVRSGFVLRQAKSDPEVIVPKEDLPAFSPG